MKWTIFTIIQLLIIFISPWLSYKINKRPLFKSWLSPVLFSYFIGIVFGNFSLIPISEEVNKGITEGGILLALPLLLLSGGVIKEIKRTGKALYAFIMAVISAMVMSSVAAFIFKDQIDDTWRLAGMLVGIYTGGVPNMQAIGLALEAPQETIILVNAADLFLGAIYLLALSSFLPIVFGKILHVKAVEQVSEEGELIEEKLVGLKKMYAVLKGLGVSVLIVAMTLGMTFLFFNEIKNVAFIILALTALSLVCSLIPAIQKIPLMYESGDYILLMFCVALGMMADFQQIIEQGGVLIAFSSVALFGSILLHLLLAKIFKVDRDTFIISSVAGVYGPVFVGQIAAVLKNRAIVVTGVLLGLLGYAVGNFLGIGLAELLAVLW